MKTSLVSSAADSVSASLLKSLEVKARMKVKADQPQQLKSVTVYWRGRKMVLMQRPQRRLSALLCKMLRRSWQNLFGTLVKSIGAGAMATAALTAQAHGGHNSAELPTGYQLIDGQARMWQHRNHMTIKQASESAIFDWQSFSIGAGGSVRFIQNDANAVALNRVLGNDPSVIMGSLTANGKIFLINAAGVLVGKTGKIDVAGFTASTLNISDTDFKAGTMNFAADPGKTIGDVQNIGMIKTKDGGSVYLIGANVENDGIISAPNGQVLLAAGSMVKLVDTALPGVSIEVSGVDGKVTNLGQIIASAGTIGIGAALIDNSGIINASSIEKEGGRIFLRATKLLTTDSTSKINADGTTGGNVQLYSDQTANIDGDVSALGSAGKGGYIDTSGKTSLSVQYVPRVGAGGEWYIDPYNVTIVADSPPDTDVNAPVVGGVIVANGTGSTIHVGTINTALNAGTGVTISTGGFVSPGGEAGDITINTGANIVKTTGGAALFSLQAAHDIIIGAGSSITDNSTGGPLSVQLYAGFSGATGNGTIQSAGDIKMGTGNFEAGSGSFINTGNLTLGGGTATFSGDVLNNNAGGVIAGTGTIRIKNDGTGTLVNAGIVKPGATSTTGGTLAITGNYQQSSSGTLEVKLDRDGGVIKSDHLNVTGNVTLAGTLAVDPTANYSSNPAATTADKVAFLNYGGTRVGNSFFTLFNGLPATMFVNYLLPFAGSGHNISMAYAPAGSSYFSGAAGTLNWADADNWSGGGAPASSANVYLDTGNGNTTFSAIGRAINALTIASGEFDVSGITLNVTGTVAVNGGTLGVLTGGTLNAGGLNTGVGGTTQISGGTTNVFGMNLVDGTMNVSGGALNVAAMNVSVGGTMLVSGGTVTNSGTTEDMGALTVSGGTLTIQQGLGIALGSTMLVSGGSASVGGTTSISGSLTTSSNGAFLFSDTFSGSGLLSIGGSSQVTENGASNSTIGHVVLNGGTFNVNNDFSTADLNMSGGQINGAAGKSFSVNGNFVQTGGTIGGTGTAKIDTASFTQATGNLAVGNINAGSLTLASANGNISQNAGTSVAADSLNANAVSGITLNNAANNIAAFSAANTVSGIIALTNSAAHMTLGTISNVNRGVSIVTTGNIASQTGGTTASELDLVAHGGIDLNSGANHIAKFAASDDLGNIDLNNVDSVEIGAISATSGIVDLEIANGVITQKANTGIQGLNLVAKATNGITLNSGTNNVGSFVASNTVSGDIILTDAATLLTLNGNVTTTAGNVTITNTGNIVSTAAHDGGGNINGITDTAGTVTISSLNGNLTLGRINATNLYISAAGKIDQESTGTGGLTITNTLTSLAGNGIKLDNASGTCGTNHVATFYGSNTGSGDITLVNVDSDGVTNHLKAITNQGGNISVNNTGALDTGTDLIKASGTVTIATHSPLTIGSGGVTGGSGVTLTAGDGTSATDVLTLNGAVQATTGSVTLGGNTIFENAAIVSLASPVVSSPNQPVQGAGYSLSAPPPQTSNQTSNTSGITTTSVAEKRVATTTDSTITKTTQTNPSNTTNVLTVPPPATTSSTASTATDQTAGGSSGEFGGGDAKDDKKDSGTKSGKPAPLCT
jgi:filamentous hemagglutinin family protein